MKLRTVRLVNFRSHHDTTIVLEDGVSAIVGPNGAGKSSIFEAAWFCLFGVCRTRTQDELIRAGEREVSVQVAFEVGCRMFDVKRQYRHAGKSGTTLLEFVETTEDCLVDHTRPTVAETERAIAEVVGPYHVLAATAYVGQGDGDRFLRARPAERRDVFGASIPVDPVWGKTLATATMEGKRLADQIARGTGILEAAQVAAEALGELTIQHVRGEEALGILTADEITWQSQYDGLRKRQIEAAPIRAANAAARARLNELRWQSGNIPPKVRDLTNRIEGAESLIGAAVEIESEANRVKLASNAYDQLLADHDDSMAQYRTVLADWESGRRVKVERLEDTRKKVSLRAEREAAVALAEQSLAEAKGEPSDRCVTCKQILATVDAINHRDTHLRFLDTRVADAYNKLLELPLVGAADIERLTRMVTEHDGLRPEMPKRPEQPDYSGYTLAISRLTMLEGARATVDADRKAMAELAAQAQELPGKIAEAEAAISPEPDINESHVEDARRRLAAARSSLEAHVKIQAGLAARVEAAQAARAKAEVLAGELATLRREQEVYALLTEACGPRGVRQLMADQALTAVQDEANRRLAVLQPGYSVYFSTLSEGGRETLDVGVSTPEGLRSFESLSGGEGIRVAMAVRIAMSTVAANMHGLAALPAFFMDEAFGSQDAAGKDAFVECIADMARTVGQVVIVSHDRDFQDRFDNKIVIEKVDGESRVTA